MVSPTVLQCYVYFMLLNYYFTVLLLWSNVAMVTFIRYHLIVILMVRWNYKRVLVSFQCAVFATVIQMINYRICETAFCYVSHVFNVCLSVSLLNATYADNSLFCQVNIKKRSFLIACVFWFFLNASSHLYFRLKKNPDVFNNYTDINKFNWSVNYTMS